MYAKIINKELVGFIDETYIEDYIKGDNEIIKKVNNELWQSLLIGIYTVNIEKLNDTEDRELTLEDKEDIFIKVEPEITIPIETIDPVKALAKQVGLLTLENKKKDVQIERLMKAVSTLMNK